MEYADLLTDVQAGRLVAVAPAVNADGEPSLIVVTGEVPPLSRFYMSESTLEMRARIAVRAVMQVRAHYGI